ncbi:MAG: SGNH/GDSL hydrolase family protein [Fimbriimonas sp.]
MTFALGALWILTPSFQTPATPPDVRSLEGVNRIVMIGDSITQGGGQPKGYVTLFAQTLKEAFPQRTIEVVNVGIGGQKAPDMLARFKSDVLDRKPDLVTISVGVNDVWHDFRTPDFKTRVPAGDSGRGVKLPAHLAALEGMIQAAKRSNVRVILLSPTLVYEDPDCPENRRLGEYARAQSSLADAQKVGFVNLHRAFRRVVTTFHEAGSQRQLLLTTDGVHLNDAGNALMADVILKYLRVPLPNRVSPGS